MGCARLLPFLLLAAGCAAQGNATRGGSLRGVAATPSCDVQAACHGCQGEQCTYCFEEEHVKCCIRDGGSQEQCCAAASAAIRGRDVCKPHCDVQAACHGCQGEQCTYCFEEERVKCCIRDGGSQGDCCASASAAIRGRAVCAPATTPRPCDPDAMCQNCVAGLDCMHCYATASVRCCIGVGGGSQQREMCCSGAGPAIKDSPVCQGTR